MPHPLPPRRWFRARVALVALHSWDPLDTPGPLVPLAPLLSPCCALALKAAKARVTHLSPGAAGGTPQPPHARPARTALSYSRARKCAPRLCHSLVGTRHAARACCGPLGHRRANAQPASGERLAAASCDTQAPSRAPRTHPPRKAPGQRTAPHRCCWGPAPRRPPAGWRTANRTHGGPSTPSPSLRMDLAGFNGNAAPLRTSVPYQSQIPLPRHPPASPHCPSAGGAGRCTVCPDRAARARGRLPGCAPRFWP
ncbi:MAG: hypothetical protein J3K34DRAFT_411549 [Monoraphidium minutum]|nr:MAG: hypothetical protein J3K34DRAFT_411549 [Monoraphidium minutum]